MAIKFLSYDKRVFSFQEDGMDGWNFRGTIHDLSVLQLVIWSTKINLLNDKFLDLVQGYEFYFIESEHMKTHSYRKCVVEMINN